LISELVGVEWGRRFAEMGTAVGGCGRTTGTDTNSVGVSVEIEIGCVVVCLDIDKIEMRQMIVTRNTINFHWGLILLASVS
jgi:hypothetical protein